jgi:hypothetical protein
MLDYDSFKNNVDIIAVKIHYCIQPTKSLVVEVCNKYYGEQANVIVNGDDSFHDIDLVLTHGQVLRDPSTLSLHSE